MDPVKENASLIDTSNVSDRIKERKELMEQGILPANTGDAAKIARQEKEALKKAGKDTTDTNIKKTNNESMASTPTFGGFSKWYNKSYSNVSLKELETFDTINPNAGGGLAVFADGAEDDTIAQGGIDDASTAFSQQPQLPSLMNLHTKSLGNQSVVSHQSEVQTPRSPQEEEEEQDMLDAL